MAVAVQGSRVPVVRHGNARRVFRRDRRDNLAVVLDVFGRVLRPAGGMVGQLGRRARDAVRKRLPGRIGRRPTEAGRKHPLGRIGGRPTEAGRKHLLAAPCWSGGRLLAGGIASATRSAPDRRQRGSSVSLGDRSAVLVSGRPRSARAAGSPRRPGPRPGRPWPGSSVRSGYRGDRGQALVPGSAKVCSSSGIASAARPAPGRRRRGCLESSGCRDRQDPAAALVPPDSARTAGSPRRSGLRPGRHWRGCSARSGFRDRRDPAYAAARPGSARTAGSPRRPGPPPGRRRRGCSASSGCRDGQDPADVRGPRPTARRPRWPAACYHPVQVGDRTRRTGAAAEARLALRRPLSRVRPKLSSSAVTCCGIPLTARRSGDPTSAREYTSSTNAAASHAAVNMCLRANPLRITRATRRCRMTVWPSRLKVSRDRSLSHSSTWSTRPASTRRPPLASTPACPAAYSSSRRTPAADSTAMISITRVHTPVRSAARTACKDSSAARAKLGGYGWPSSPVRDTLAGVARSRSRYRAYPGAAPRSPAQPEPAPAADVPARQPPQPRPA